MWISSILIVLSLKFEAMLLGNELPHPCKLYEKPVKGSQWCNFDFT